MDITAIEFGREERIIRPIGPIGKFEVVFGQMPDGGLVAATFDDPAKEGFAGTGENLVWKNPDGFICRSYFAFYAIERYADLELRLVLGPYHLIRTIMICSQQKGQKSPSDPKTGLDFAIRFERGEDKDRNWQYKIWSLGEKPLTKEEKLCIKSQHVQFDKININTPAEEIKQMLATSKPCEHPVWEPDNCAAIPCLLDFLAGEPVAKE
jgi:hypothetical protein